MKTLQLLLVCLSALTISVGAAQGQAHGLKFNPDGQFKIVQFTDLHAIPGDKRSDTAFTCMRKVIEYEKPDLVIVTGDIIYAAPAEKNLQTVLQVISDSKTPFAITFGNHDRQMGKTNAELLRVARAMPYNINGDTEGISGDGNCDLVVGSSKGDTPAAVLYLIDSHEDSELKEVGIKGYNYIHRDQIEWYANTSKRHTQANQGKPLPSLAFFHIPLTEFTEAISDPGSQSYGIHREKPCPSLLNSGLFTAFKEQNDVLGAFVGHDHDNDFAVMWHGVLLAYGRFSGGPTEYINIPNGARVISMKEGERKFDTWIRLTDGTIEQRTTYPESYIKK